MTITAFTSQWIPTLKQKRVLFNGTVCSSCPKMTLISHEKLATVQKAEEVEVANYKLTLEIPGEYSKKKRRESIQGMKAQANFKGFRKGTIPPFIMRELEDFILQESCMDMVSEAAAQLELSMIDEADSAPEFDIAEMKKSFQVGEDFTFSCEVPLQFVNVDLSTENLEDIVALEPENVPNSDASKTVDAK